MATNLVYQEASNLISSIANHALVVPLVDGGDPYTIGISGLIFDIIGDVGVEINSEITDHYVESNYAVQDHWAQKPMIVTMQGYAAELVSVFQPNALQTIFSSIEGLIAYSGFAPVFNTQDTQFYNQLNSVTQLGQNLVNTTSNAFQLFNSFAGFYTKQQTVFQYLLNMWHQRILATVETPFGLFNNMAIESIRPTQSKESTKISEFVVRFKQILTVKSVQGTSNADSTQNQNTGTTSTASPTPSSGLTPYVANAVSLGSGYGTATPTSTMLGVFQNQASL